MLEEIFEDSKKNQTLIGIHLYGESGFWCGYVDDYNEEFIQLKHFNKYGDSDGVLVERVSQIESIDIEDDYLKALKLTIEKNQELRNDTLKTRIFEELDEDNWQFVCLKPYENDRNVLVGIQINNSSFYRGFVLKIDDLYLKFEIIGNAGESEGSSLFHVDDVNAIKINDLECRRRLILYQGSSQ